MEGFSWEVIAEILGALFILSEALAKIPALKANSVFELVQGFLSKFKKA
jgi:hypothetical protein